MDALSKVAGAKKDAGNYISRLPLRILIAQKYPEGSSDRAWLELTFPYAGLGIHLISKDHRCGDSERLWNPHKHEPLPVLVHPTRKIRRRGEVFFMLRLRPA